MFLLLIIANFLLILISIIAFMAPFFLWYWLKHRESLGAINFNTYLEHFFSSKQANWLVFFWAAGEAVIWFVIPEFLLLLVVFMRIQRKRQLLVYDIAGTVVGTVLALLMRLPQHAISNLPYIQEKMVQQTVRWFDTQGILALVHQPFSGVPYKVFTHLAWQYHFFFLYFIFFAVSVRLIRYIIAYGLFISLYPKLHHRVQQNYLPLFFIAIFIFSVLLLKTYRLYA